MKILVDGRLEEFTTENDINTIFIGRYIFKRNKDDNTILIGTYATRDYEGQLDDPQTLNVEYVARLQKFLKFQFGDLT